MSIDIVAAIRKNPFVLAPMAGITDCAFRSFMRALGTPVVVTELVSANGLKYSSEKTKKLMQFEEEQRPVGIQIFGETPEAMGDAARFVEEYGADFVDINFGCPVKKVVKKGAGSAALKDLVYLREIISATKESLNIPLTIKIRTGWDADTKNAEKVCEIAHEEGVSWVAIHGRTRAQSYSGEADWEYIRWIKENSPLPVIGNGDITSAQIANHRLRESGCDAVMIGRGCLKNPWIFQESLNLYNLHQQIDIERNYTKVILRLRKSLERTQEERVVGLQIKKFASWYSAGFPGSSEFRKSVFQSKTLDETLDRTLTFFQNVSYYQKKDTSHEAFLMGGHG